MVERIDVSVRYNLDKTRSDSDIVTSSSVPMISTQQSVDVGNLTLLQLLSAVVALSGHCSATVAVHCRRHRIYSLQKFLGNDGGAGRHASKYVLSPR